MTLILRKLLASSSFAIASTLGKLVYKLDQSIADTKAKTAHRDPDTASLLQDFEALPEMSDEWIDDEEGGDDEDEKEQKALTEKDIVLMEQEKADLERFRNLAQAIYTNSKGDALLTALKKGFEMTAELGAKKKAIIFTESTITDRKSTRLNSSHSSIS